MPKTTPLTAERLRELLHYDPQTGVFKWLVTLCGRALAGGVAGSLRHQGYLSVGVDGGHYVCHRLAWLYMTGAWPAKQIDHINGARADNRWSNLREVTNRQNCQNRHKGRSRSGLLGVGTQYGKFQSAIQDPATRKRLHLGTFLTASEAHAAYAAKRVELGLPAPQGGR